MSYSLGYIIPTFRKVIGSFFTNVGRDPVNISLYSHNVFLYLSSHYMYLGKNQMVGLAQRFFPRLPPLGPRFESRRGALSGLGFQSLPDRVGFPLNTSLGFSSHI